MEVKNPPDFAHYPKKARKEIFISDFDSVFIYKHIGNMVKDLKKSQVKIWRGGGLIRSSSNGKGKGRAIDQNLLEPAPKGRWWKKPFKTTA